MLVYGDHREICDPQERLNEIDGELEIVRRLPPGLERHSRLVAALIETGRILQGVADAGAPAGELNLFLYRLAQAVLRSHDTQFRALGELPGTLAMELPGCVELSLPEGFAFYAVYPEAYADAARRLRLLGPPRVIGIRSIGTTLGAVVAAALDAPPPITARPFGDPFARQVDLTPEVFEEDVHYVIVDEGPGLSGSSFGSVADWFQQRGVPIDRIAFLPSHSGDLGPQSSEAHRERWRRAQRVAAEFNPSFLVDEFGPLAEFSIGRLWERRKFLATKDGTPVLLKFAGLGRTGQRKLEIARWLFAGGFVPEPLGLVHGFIVERWCSNVRPLLIDEVPLTGIAAYIAARAELPRVEPLGGASVDELLEMIQRNVALELGNDAANSLDSWKPYIDDLGRRVRRIPTDNKLDRDEWLRAHDGALVKVDALDHHCGHDLIGCQDIAWDVAGAIAEFDLDRASADEMIRSAGLDVDRQLLRFCLVAYCAFRLGSAKLGEEVTAATRYAAKLQRLLELTPSAKRLKSLVD